MISNDNNKYECKTIREAFIYKPLYLLFIMFFLSTVYGMFIAINIKQLGLIHLHNDNFLTWCVSAGSICNGGSRIVWGRIIDRYKFKYTYGVLLII